MSNDRTNLWQEEVSVGDPVRVTENFTATRVNATDRHTLTPLMELTVTRVYSNTLMVRTVENVATSSQWGGVDHKQASFSIDRRYLTDFDPSHRPRRLGQKPEDTEEMEYIDKTDPRIQWLWEDLGRYADEQGYCSQYDALTARIGIPGRPRDFTVTLELNGVRFTGIVQARSQAEANQRAQEAAGVGKTVVEVLDEE